VTATSIVRVSATEITCVTPVGTDGAQDVVVTNTDTGTVTEIDGFTYISTPTITLIDPATGAAAGGTAVTITGTEFGTTPAVTFDGVTATSIVRVSATSITCVTPAGSAGAVDVVVTNTDTGTITATDGFTYTE
jgi:Na+-translocating ferredoxin:NAD+ oxidoreductase RnfG subunit